MAIDEVGGTTGGSTGTTNTGETTGGRRRASGTPAVSGASLNPIYERLHNAPQYHPLEADTFADWTLEAGDIVTIERDGKTYESPVHTSVMTWKKKQQVMISSTGNEKRDAVSKASQKKYRGGSASLRNSKYQHIYVEDQYNQLKAGLYLTSSTAHLYVDNKYAQMQSGLYLTSSTAKLYVDNRYAQMTAGLDLTSSTAKLYVDNRYAQMTAGLDLTSSTAHLYVDNKYAQMTAGLDLTSSTAKLYVDNKYSQMTAGLDLTSSTAKLYVDNKYAQMTAGLDLTSSSAKLYVDNKYAQMTAGLDLTSSTAKLYVDNKYSQMTAGLDLTSSTAKLYVDNKYAQMTAGLDLTSSTAKLYVDNKYSQMQAGLDLTSSTAKLYVDNKYAQMTAGLDLTSSSARMYASSADNAAEIVARINESTGESEIKLDAQRVYIGTKKSTTVINGKLEATDFDAQHIAALLTNTSVLSTAYMFSNSMEIGTGTFTMDDFNCYIPDAYHALQIVQDGNTYKLQGKHFYSLDWADIGSFSRAVNSASWGWVSGYPKVTLSPQGQSFNGSGLTLDGITYSNKTWTQDKKKFSARFYVYDVSGNEPYGDDLLIDTEDSWNAGWDGYYDSEDWASPVDNNGTCLRPKKDRTGSETWFTLDVNIPSNQIYTTDNNPRGTKLTTLRDRFIQAQRDSEYVCFRIDCGGVQKWYYMEP